MELLEFGYELSCSASFVNVSLGLGCVYILFIQFQVSVQKCLENLQPNETPSSSKTIVRKYLYNLLLWYIFKDNQASELAKKSNLNCFIYFFYLRKNQGYNFTSLTWNRKCSYDWQKLWARLSQELQVKPLWSFEDLLF